MNAKCKRNLDITTRNVEPLLITLMSNNSKSTVMSTTYRPPDGDFKCFNTFLRDLYSIALKSNELFYATFNLNVLDCEKKKKERKKEKITEFLNLTFNTVWFQSTTRVIKNTGTAIDYIITNSPTLMFDI